MNLLTQNSPTVNFFLRGKESASPEKPCVIYASIEVNGDRCTAFSTKIKIPAKYWMVETEAPFKYLISENPVSQSYPLAQTINTSLNNLRQEASKIMQDLQENDLPVSAMAIKEELLSPKSQPTVKKFIDVVDELIAAQKVKRKKQTMLTYRTRRNNINKYLLEKNRTRLYIHDFRFDHFEEMQQWMMSKLNEDGTRRWCNNTINKHLTLVNKVLKYGINKRYIKSNPLGVLGLEYEDSNPPQYLSPRERQRIHDCTLVTLTKEKDISIFLYSTGLSYTDYLSLKQQHLFQLDSGEWFIKKERDKSNVFSIIPLLPQAQEIIGKYGGIANLPRPDISDLNKALKILGEICQLPFSLSTSTFRETFSSMMENEYMIQSRTLMFMMGHTNERQLKNYSSVMPARVLHELKKDNFVIAATWKNLGI